MIVITTDTVLVCIGIERDCQCLRYLLGYCDKVFFLRAQKCFLMPKKCYLEFFFP